MSRGRELAKIEADAGYITSFAWPGKQMTFRENVCNAIEAACRLGERLGRERLREDVREFAEWMSQAMDAKAIERDTRSEPHYLSDEHPLADAIPRLQDNTHH